MAAGSDVQPTQCTLYTQLSLAVQPPGDQVWQDGLPDSQALPVGNKQHNLRSQRVKLQGEGENQYGSDQRYIPCAQSQLIQQRQNDLWKHDCCKDIVGHSGRGVIISDLHLREMGYKVCFCMVQKCPWVSSEMTCLWMVDGYVTEVYVSVLRDDMFVDGWWVCYRSVCECPQRWHVCGWLMRMLQKCPWVSSEMTCLWMVDGYVTEVSVSGLRDDMFVHSWCVCYRSVSEWPQRWHVCRQLMRMLQKCQWVSSEMTCL